MRQITATITLLFVAFTPVYTTLSYVDFGNTFNTYGDVQDTTFGNDITPKYTQQNTNTTFGNEITPKYAPTNTDTTFGNTIEPKITPRPRRTPVPICDIIPAEQPDYQKCSPRFPRITPRATIIPTISPTVKPTIRPTSTPVPPPVRIPTVSLLANNHNNSITINYGQPVTLSWQSLNTTSCQAFYDWTGNLGTGGALIIEQVTSNKLFAITCTGQYGSATDSVSVIVRNQPTPTPVANPTVDLKVNNSDNQITIQSGNSVNLSWTSSDATSCVAANAWSGSRSTSGNEQINNILIPATFTLICFGNGKTVSDSVSVALTQNNAQLSLSKLVRNLSRGSQTATESVVAQPEDTIEFVIEVKGQGSISATNVRLTDTLPYGLRYVQNSTRNNGSLINDGINQNGINLGTIAPNQNNTIIFRATVASANVFTIGTTEIINTAKLYADNLQTLQNDATVYVNKAQTVIDNTQKLTIQKFGRNITRGQSVEQTNIVAYPNDTVEFVIRIKPIGNYTTDHIIIKDILPSGLSYLSGTTSINNIVTNDGIITSAGLSVGSISPNNEIIVRFSTRVNQASLLTYGTTVVANSVTAYSDDITISNVAQLPISIVNNFTATTGTIGNAGQIPTGATSTLAIALGISTAIALGYYFYKQTSFAERRTLVALMNRQSSDKSRFNFVLN